MPMIKMNQTDLVISVIAVSSLVGVIGGILFFTISEEVVKQHEEEHLDKPEQVNEPLPNIEKEKEQVATVSDTITEPFVITEKFYQDMDESEMRRLELNRVKPEGYQEMVLSEFKSGKLSHVTSCSQLNAYYLLYYGQVYGNQWDYSNNKKVTDYLKERMWAIDCEFNEQAELKAQIDFERERVENATKKVMAELEKVNEPN